MELVKSEGLSKVGIDCSKGKAAQGRRRPGELWAQRSKYEQERRKFQASSAYATAL